MFICRVYVYRVRKLLWMEVTIPNLPAIWMLASGVVEVARWGSIASSNKCGMILMSNLWQQDTSYMEKKSCVGGDTALHITPCNLPPSGYADRWFKEYALMMWLSWLLIYTFEKIQFRKKNLIIISYTLESEYRVTGYKYSRVIDINIGSTVACFFMASHRATWQLH